MGYNYAGRNAADYCSMKQKLEFKYIDKSNVPYGNTKDLHIDDGPRAPRHHA